LVPAEIQRTSSKVKLIEKEDTDRNSDLELEALEHRNTIQAILRFIYLPISILIALILLALIVFYFQISAITVAMPTIMTLCGFGVAFVGAFWDFGARKYLNSLANSRIIFTEKDVTRINRQQLQLTLIYLGIAGLYIMSAAFIYLYF